VLGRLLAAGAEKRQLAAQHETEEFIATSFGEWDAATVPATGDGTPVPAPVGPSTRPTP
jgi:hypothetical protein